MAHIRLKQSGDGLPYPDEMVIRQGYSVNPDFQVTMNNYRADLTIAPGPHLSILSGTQADSGSIIINSLLPKLLKKYNKIAIHWWAIAYNNQNQSNPNLRGGFDGLQAVYITLPKGTYEKTASGDFYIDLKDFPQTISSQIAHSGYVSGSIAVQSIKLVKQ